MSTKVHLHQHTLYFYYFQSNYVYSTHFDLRLLYIPILPVDNTFNVVEASNNQMTMYVVPMKIVIELVFRNS